MSKKRYAEIKGQKIRRFIMLPERFDPARTKELGKGVFWPVTDMADPPFDRKTHKLEGTDFDITSTPGVVLATKRVVELTDSDRDYLRKGKERRQARAAVQAMLDAEANGESVERRLRRHDAILARLAKDNYTD